MIRLSDLLHSVNNVRCIFQWLSYVHPSASKPSPPQFTSDFSLATLTLLASPSSAKVADPGEDSASGPSVSFVTALGSIVVTASGEDSSPLLDAVISEGYPRPPWSIVVAPTTAEYRKDA